MVFDEWYNSIPVAFIITSCLIQEDLKPWMVALKQSLLLEMLEWKPNAFIGDYAQGKINSLQYVSGLEYISFSNAFPSEFLCIVHLLKYQIFPFPLFYIHVFSYFTMPKIHMFM